MAQISQRLLAIAIADVKVPNGPQLLFIYEEGFFLGGGLSGILALVPVSDELNAISKLKWLKWMSGQRIYLVRDKEQL